MPDPWLSEEELKKHEDEVKNHPLTKQAEEARDAAEKEHEEYRKEQAELQKKAQDGELVPTYSNGAVTGYRNAEDVPEEELALGGSGSTGIRPKAEGRGGSPEDNEIGPAGDDAPKAPHGNVESTEPSAEDQKKAEEKTEKRAAENREKRGADKNK